MSNHVPRGNPGRRALRFEPLEARHLLAAFTVNTALDTVAVDANVSALDAAGHISLRSAIQRANALAGADSINLPAGMYNLTIGGADEDLSATGDLDITGDLTITGASAATTIINAAGIPGGDRVLETHGVITVDIWSLSVTGGLVAGSGGGILNRSGLLRLTHSTVAGNKCINSPTLTVNGGGISNGYLDEFGEVQSATLELRHTTVSNNESVRNGGGIYNGGVATLTGCSIVGNKTKNNGGGIANADDDVSGVVQLTVTYSTVSDNTGPAGWALEGGGIYNGYQSQATVSNSTISNNQARISGSGSLNTVLGEMTVLNTTISNNAAVGSPTATEGGGIGNWGNLALNHVTISNNSATFGSGIFTYDGTLTVTNSIIANSCQLLVLLTSGGHNIDGSVDGSALLSGPGDMLANPLLGPLANNGGPTLTRALLVGSPAIDAGDNAASTATDQRGRARPADGDGNAVATVDIGAYEYLAAPIDVVVTAGTSQAALDQLMFISGALVLDATTRPDLMLPLLVLVDGDLNISGNTEITTIDVPSMGEVGGSVVITDNTSVTTISMSDLDIVSVDLNISDNPAVTTISMSDLDIVSVDLNISSNPALTTIDLPSLGEVGGSVVITDNTAATTISMDALATVGGDMTTSGNTSVTTISMDGLASVGGDMTTSGNTSVTTISMDGLASVGGDMTTSGNTSATTISMDGLATVGGDMSTSGNTSATTISMDGLATVGGGLTVSGNSSLTTFTGYVLTSTGADIYINGNLAMTIVNLPNLTDVAGNLTAEAMDSVAAVTADGATELTLATAEASLTAVLQTGTFASPVAFSVSRFASALLSPEAGEDASGGAATIDPLFSYQFAFDIPTLGTQATLTFEIDVAALAPADQTALVAALASGRLSVAVKNDAPGSVYQAFALCGPGETPVADDCVAVTLLDANRDPLPEGSLDAPAFVVFEGVTGHFSSFAVVVVAPPLPGDYNGDNAVNSADYTVWRDTEGGSVAAYDGADGSGNGTVDDADYEVWKMHFGETLPMMGAGSGASVEENQPQGIGTISTAGQASSGTQTEDPHPLATNADQWCASVPGRCPSRPLPEGEIVIGALAEPVARGAIFASTGRVARPGALGDGRGVLNSFSPRPSLGALDVSPRLRAETQHDTIRHDDAILAWLAASAAHDRHSNGANADRVADQPAGGRTTDFDRSTHGLVVLDDAFTNLGAENW